MPWLFAVLFSAGLVSCALSSPPPVPSAEARPAHHLGNGYYQNTDTAGGILRDTLLPDSLVSSSRTRVYALPIHRGQEHLWEDSLSSATWIGQATYYLRLKGVGVLTDPIFSNRASPVSFVGPKRGTPPGRALDSLPGVDWVLISHGHYDHLDKRSIQRLLDIYPHAMYAVPLGLASLLSDWGVAPEKVVELDWWQTYSWNGIELQCVPAHHTTRRGLFQSSRNHSLWCGWVLTQGARKMWFAGDLGMGNGEYYQKIAQVHGAFDLVLLPIGNYLPARYTSVHISPRQAVQLHLLVHSKLSLAMHWGTFGMTYEKLEDPPHHLAQALEQYQVPPQAFRAPAHGEIVPLDW